MCDGRIQSTSMDFNSSLTDRWPGQATSPAHIHQLKGSWVVYRDWDENENEYGYEYNPDDDYYIYRRYITPCETHASIGDWLSKTRVWRRPST